MTTVMDEDLREASCVGDIDKISFLIKQGADVNSKNPVNAWFVGSWNFKT